MNDNIKLEQPQKSPLGDLGVFSGGWEVFLFK